MLAYQSQLLEEKSQQVDSHCNKQVFDTLRDANVIGTNFLQSQVKFTSCMRAVPLCDLKKEINGILREVLLFTSFCEAIFASFIILDSKEFSSLF